MSEQLNITFNYEPRKWQIKCYEAQKRFTVLAVHRRAGKTTLAISELIVKALDTNSIGLYAYIAPELKQAKLISWKALKDMCQQFRNVRVGKKIMDLVEFRESDLTVKFWNGSEIRLFGADNPDSLRGSKLAGAIIDEVAQMPKELWLEIVYPALMDSQGWALFIGTPKGINLFSELFDRGLDEQFKDTWTSLRFTCYETDALKPEDIEEYRKSVPDEVFKREMLCDFTANSANQLISLFDAQQASHKTIDENFLGKAPLILGVDVARFGADRSVLCYRRGILVEQPIIYHGVSTTELSRIIKEQVIIRNPKVINIDGTGVGGGVVDNLNAWGIYANDINFGHKSLDQQYTNRRTEMWCKMADWVHKGGIIPRDDNIVAELAMPTYDVNDKCQKVLESKKQIRDRLGKSPDVADAIALTFAEDMPLDEEQEDPYFCVHPKRKQVQSFNPWGQFEYDIQNRKTYL